MDFVQVLKIRLWNCFQRRFWTIWDSSFINTWYHTDGGNEDNGDPLQKVPCRHCCTQSPNPAAGHRWPMSPLESPGHTRASLGQFLVGSLLLSPGSWCAQGFVCARQECVSPVLRKFWQLYGGVNGDLFQEGLCHTQVYCTQSPCPCSSPLLTHTSIGDTQTLTTGPGEHMVCYYL